MASAVILPAELTDMIIDHLHNDKDALQACSRVCRTWLPSSRHHLFEKISLAFYFYGDIHRSYSFLKLLESPLCTIPSHVRSVYLTDLGYTEITTVLRRLSMFSAVCKLEVETSTLTNDNMAALVANFGSVKALVFRVVETCISVGRVLAHLPDLTALTLINFEWSPTHSLHAPPQCLRDLVLSSQTLSDILVWLAGVQHAHLRTFELGDLDPTALPALDALVGRIPELRHLVLDLSHMSAATDTSKLPQLAAAVASAAHLPAHSALRTLTLRDGFKGAPLALLPEQLALLARAPPPALEVLILDLCPKTAALSWLALDAAIPADALTGLRSIKVHVHAGLLKDAERVVEAALVRAALPALDKRGILEVVMV